MDNCGCIVDIMISIDETNNCCETRELPAGLNDLVEFAQIGSDKPRLEKQVFRGISRQGKFWKTDKVRFGLISPSHTGQNGLCVVIEVSNSNVDLGKCDA